MYTDLYTLLEVLSFQFFACQIRRVNRNWPLFSLILTL
ncbi:hypothetical protein VCHC02A1_0763 [Vibrio cholerae HC-02A1]|nr:hypothetical protein VCHC02A1_0763 [Vibrio cholerae HC-02A1]KKP10168.1 hypothetical protein VS84_02921 [Vibrio cholerae]KKP19402.1 hypothetical protein VS86_02644 [Vibrio cholerae]